MIRHTLPFLLATAIARAQFFELEFSEVLIQPGAGDHQAIELSTANVPMNLAGHHLVVDAVAVALPNISLPAFSSTIMHLGVAGSTGAGHIYLPAAPALQLAGSIALFRSSQFTSPAELVDYVGWGGALGPQIGLAVQAGRWTDPDASALLPSAVGSTLANRRYARNTGNLIGPDAWYDDSTPTLGGENDPGWTYWYALGCPGTAGVQFGVPPGNDPGPWMGEPTWVSVSPGYRLAVLVLSSTATQPVSLASVGMPGCFAHLTCEWTALLTGGFGGLTYHYTVPVNPVLVGASLHMQAFVPGPGLSMFMQGQVTEALRAVVGSR